MDNKKIAYIYSKDLIKYCDRLTTIANRASIVQDLIENYSLLSLNNVNVIKSIDATEEELKLFHSSSYVEFLKEMNDEKDVELEDCSEKQIEFGLSYDCPLLENCYDMVKAIAGASLTASKLLIKNQCRIAINWFGGWHHAQRDSAEGFCYVNDVVIAIQELTKKYNKILYIDMDIHHGNGVQNAFEFSNKILTLSLHNFAPGFYPGTGSLEEIGKSAGKYYAINVPLLPGVSHKSYTEIFTKVFFSVYKSFQPAAIVVQCGADGLNGDPIGESNLTIKTYEHCVNIILSCDLPTLFLGGGGYNIANTARLWTSLTALILNQPIAEDIPDTCEFFELYGPAYDLHVDEGKQKDLNTAEHVEKLITTIQSYCGNVN